MTTRFDESLEEFAIFDDPILVEDARFAHLIIPHIFTCLLWEINLEIISSTITLPIALFLLICRTRQFNNWCRLYEGFLYTNCLFYIHIFLCDVKRYLFLSSIFFFLTNNNFPPYPKEKGAKKKKKKPSSTEISE